MRRVRRRPPAAGEEARVVGGADPRLGLLRLRRPRLRDVRRRDTPRGGGADAGGGPRVR